MPQTNPHNTADPRHVCYSRVRTLPCTALNIRSSRLMVRVGGGYCDFLEYLSKASI